LPCVGTSKFGEVDFLKNTKVATNTNLCTSTQRTWPRFVVEILNHTDLAAFSSFDAPCMCTRESSGNAGFLHHGRLELIQVLSLRDMLRIFEFLRCSSRSLSEDLKTLAVRSSITPQIFTVQGRTRFPFHCHVTSAMLTFDEECTSNGRIILCLGETGNRCATVLVVGVPVVAVIEESGVWNMVPPPNL
jgi:hypothetical protein